MKTPYAYLALLDVLGYSDGLNRDDETFGNKIYDAFNEVFRYLDMAEYNFEFFSDSIIISCSHQENFIGLLKIIKGTTMSFLKKGFFLRGGIAYDKHIKRGAFTYSHALLRAQYLQPKALFPRIIIDNNIIEMFNSANEFPELINSKLICYNNGIYFLNILDKENWSDAYEYASRIFLDNRDYILGKEHELAKHVWFEEYLFSSPFANTHCLRYIPINKLLD